MSTYLHMYKQALISIAVVGVLSAP